MPQRIDALIRPRWTIRVDPAAAVEHDVAVAVDNGRILDVVPGASALERYDPDALHDRPGHVLMPGLVNAHCHAGMSLFRGFADDLPLERWLEEHIWPAESQWAGPELIADGTRLAIAEMLLGGVTCFADMYYFPDVVAEVSIEAGMRVAVGMIALDFATPWAADPDEYIEKGLEVHDRHKHDPLVSTTFAPHAPYSVGDETLERIRRLADELDVPIHTHIHETAHEVETAVAQTGRRPLERFAALGLVTPALMGVHATRLTPGEIEQLALARASVVHCPRSNLKLASGACPVQSLIDAGVNVALGTDGAASNNRLDLFSELELAALLGKLVAEDATAVPAATVLQMATLNGARALGLAEQTGSITAGKAADLVCVDLAGIAQQPVLDPLSHLVYSASRDQVADVWVAGEHLVSNGTLQRMDEAAIIDASARWADRLTGR